ncbi:hypothetical protein [Gordonia rhizosphera]|uniref:Uncharacterized protein n=1 Tax=Gordonia rhizosphera NBRC 16068 TaxID=1108045 RepID=K6VS30_9ACTN|nr:hypothetical protein [Gordonia rhizosphera]GAB89720.1 hypothetical protein GORHZ_069_00990 [Gordonia rhizosphera NBRC 16068]
MAESTESRNSVRTQQLCLWSVPVTGVILLVAFAMFPGFFPPMSPDESATQVANFYRDNTSRIQFSMVVFNLFNVMLVPFYAVVVTQIRRMATPSQVLGFCYLTAVVSGATLFALADIFWLVAAFRPERNPELVQLLNDLAWIVLVAPVGMMVVQGLVLALAVYLDDRANPVLPRWVCPFNLVAAALWAPAAGAAVARTGPFAWDGFFSFWLHWTVLAVYVITMLVVLTTAVRRQSASAPLVDDMASNMENAV